MDASSYRERVAWPAWFYLVVGTALAIGIFGTAGALLRHGLGLGPGVALVALLVVAAVLWRLRFIVLEFGPQGASFGFGRSRRHVPADRIVSAEVEAYSVARYMGWGYRLGWEPRDRAYSVIGCARGVRLIFDDERGRRWKVFLACRDPEAAISALDR
jgi:hypothetical protein